MLQPIACSFVIFLHVTSRCVFTESNKLCKKTCEIEQNCTRHSYPKYLSALAEMTRARIEIVMRVPHKTTSRRNVIRVLKTLVHERSVVILISLASFEQLLLQVLLIHSHSRAKRYYMYIVHTRALDVCGARTYFVQ